MSQKENKLKQKKPKTISTEKVFKLIDSKYILTVDDLKKHYGKTQVLTGINFKVEPGEHIAIVGANGAGKTTLAEIIAKVKEPSSGEVQYAFGKTKSDISANIGIQFQDSKYPDFYRVHDLVKFIINVSNVDISKERLIELYKTFDLYELRKEIANSLSGGQQQRLNILLAIANNPKLLILDEVGTGLDVESRTKIKAYIKSYSKTHGAAILLVSHNSDEVVELCKRVITIHNGKIWEDQPLKNILTKWKRFDDYMSNLYLNVFKKNLDLRANKTGRHKRKNKTTSVEMNRKR